MITKLHEFKIDADKRICPTCNDQRELAITNTIHPKTKQIIGAILSLQCFQCYSPQESILNIIHLQPKE